MQIINQAGPNGDDTLYVQFFTSPVKMDFRSEEEGRPIYEERLHVRIQAPGDNLNVVEREAHEGDKIRFPRQWMAYQVRQTEAVEGTPLDKWPN